MIRDWVSQQLRAAISSTTGLKTRRWLGLGVATVANHELDHIPVAADVVVYFSDVVNKAYQLEQWLPTLEKLHELHRVVLVFRKVPTMRYFKALTDLPKIYVRRFDDLVNFYDFNDFKLCLYVNNGVANFQSLSASRPVHVHVNHGESDKLSMVSNQAKAYDKIFVAGQAAIERHEKVLVDFDLTKLLSVGRPQLDARFGSELSTFDGQTVLYAPTWEGENEANNYTSIDLFGISIIEALVSIPDTRVIYKPRPRILASSNPEISSAHSRISTILQTQNSAGAHHVIAEKQNILALFEHIDALVTDVSSVGLDYLYLHPSKPLILTDRRNDIDKLHGEAPISRVCPIINKTTSDSLLASIGAELRSTPNEEHRLMRSFYFGDRERGESTTNFLSAIDSLIKERETKLSGYRLRGNAIDSGEVD